MRTFAAILLLSLLAFNWFGYQIVSSYLQNRVTVQLDKKLDDAEYDESELLEIRIAVSAPYQINQPQFERCYGEVEFSGTHYTYVKRKFFNDSLILLCLPNKAKTDIANAENSFYKLVNGLQSGASEKTSDKSNAPVYKNILAEFIAPESKCASNFILEQTCTAYPNRKVPVYNSFKLPLPEVPPDSSVSSLFC